MQSEWKTLSRKVRSFKCSTKTLLIAVLTVSVLTYIQILLEFPKVWNVESSMLFINKFYKPRKNHEKDPFIQQSQFDDVCDECDQITMNDSKPSSNLKVCDLCAVSNNIIFFIESTKATSLRSRHACAIESAAKYHPDKRIILYVVSPKDCDENGVMKIICNLKNVEIHLIDLQSLFDEMNMFNFEERFTRNPEFRAAHVSDIVRLILLWKHGGLYLDLDIIVLREMSIPGGYISKEVPFSIANGLMKIPPRSVIVDYALRKLNASYTGTEWTEAGPLLFTALFKTFCGDDVLDRGIVTCRGVTILPTELFYAIDADHWRTYWDDDPKSVFKVLEATKDSYTGHYWNFASHRERIVPGVQQGVSYLGSLHCPNVFKYFPDDSL